MTTLRNNLGFTLIEVLVALVIIVISFVAITNSIIYSQMNSQKSRKSIIASFLASEKLAEVNMKYSALPIKEIPQKESGIFPKPNDTFSWEVKSQPFEYDLAGLAETFFNKEEAKSEQLQSILSNMSNALKESIKEVTVTIHWSTMKIPRNFSLTTHFIDKQLQVPSLGMPDQGGGK